MNEKYGAFDKEVDVKVVGEHIWLPCVRGAVIGISLPMTEGDLPAGEVSEGQRGAVSG